MLWFIGKESAKYTVFYYRNCSPIIEYRGIMSERE